MVTYHPILNKIKSELILFLLVQYLPLVRVNTCKAKLFLMLMFPTAVNLWPCLDFPSAGVVDVSLHTWLLFSVVKYISFISSLLEIFVLLSSHIINHLHRLFSKFDTYHFMTKNKNVGGMFCSCIRFLLFSFTSFITGVFCCCCFGFLCVCLFWFFETVALEPILELAL